MRDTDERTDDEEMWSESAKVELLAMVMTGKIKRKDFLKSIKTDE